MSMSWQPRKSHVVKFCQSDKHSVSSVKLLGNNEKLLSICSQFMRWDAAASPRIRSPQRDRGRRSGWGAPRPSAGPWGPCAATGRGPGTEPGRPSAIVLSTYNSTYRRACTLRFRALSIAIFHCITISVILKFHSAKMWN